MPSNGSSADGCKIVRPEFGSSVLSASGHPRRQAVTGPTAEKSTFQEPLKG